jgi:hypothetical protein
MAPGLGKHFALNTGRGTQLIESLGDQARLIGKKIGIVHQIVRFTVREYVKSMNETVSFFNSFVCSRDVNATKI